MSEKPAERFALSEDQYAEIVATDPDVEHLKVGVKGVGVVVLKPPTRGDYKRFAKRIGRSGAEQDETLEELARCCVAWPDVKELDAEIERRRKFGAWTALGNQAAKLSGLLADDLEGN